MAGTLEKLMTAWQVGDMGKLASALLELVPIALFLDALIVIIVFAVLVIKGSGRDK